MRGALAALGLSLLACGYSLSHGGRLPKGASGLRVAAVVNRTAQAEAGGLFGGALRDELAARGQLGEDAAQPVAELEIKLMRSAPSALGAGGAFAFRLEADVRLRMLAPAGEMLYDDALLSGEDYLAGEDVVETEANRRAALRRLTRSMARELVDKLDAAGRTSTK